MNPTPPPPRPFVAPTDPPAPPPSTLRSHVGGPVNGAVVLAMIYFGREVLVPITLAVILSLLIAPLVRALKRCVRNQVAAVLGAVVALALCVGGLAVVIGSQVVSMAASLPQYESTIRDKIAVVQEVTLGRMQMMQGETGRMISRLGAEAAASTPPRATLAGAPLTASGAVPVEIRPRTQTPVELMSHLFSSIWGPLGRASIVLIVMVFVLLEHESLRDRFIRLLGGSDLRRTTHAFNDAGERLSRFFASQFAVNVGVGAVIWLGLLAVGLPHGMLWAVLTMLLRFVPYVGVFVAAGSAGLMAAAVDPGWSMMFMTLGLFTVVELLAAQVVEPQLYGHSTGLSPLSVVVAAIFWSWIWGPIGLLVSTPLTLCLVVGGRHIKGLQFLDTLLGDTPALSMSESFYQRALSGDAEEIIAGARTYLKRRSFARYCDKILMPAMRLAGADLATGSITPQQQLAVKGAIVQVIEALGPDTRKRTRRQRRVSVLDEDNIGVHLRHQREAAIGQYQGPLAVPPGSVALCVGLGSMRDDLVTEILVRILRDLEIDARHLSLDDLERGPPPGSSVGSVAMLFVVSAYPALEWPRVTAVVGQLRERFPSAAIVGLLPMDGFEGAEDTLDRVARSFEEAVEHAGTRYPSAEHKRAAAAVPQA
ncbi:MAG: AI-2E family transporter [Betaproteobacteria bacterium]